MRKITRSRGEILRDLSKLSEGQKGPFSNLVVVFSGIKNETSLDYLQRLVTSKGGQVRDTVDKDVNLLVYKNPGLLRYVIGGTAIGNKLLKITSITKGVHPVLGVMAGGIAGLSARELSTSKKQYRKAKKSGIKILTVKEFLQVLSK